jgi:hypothetical protein
MRIDKEDIGDWICIYLMGIAAFAATCCVLGLLFHCCTSAI